MLAPLLIRWLCSIDPEVRRLWAARILIASVVGWVVSHVILVLAGESTWFNHIVMAISWLAITSTCWDVIATADVRAEQDTPSL